MNNPTDVLTDKVALVTGAGRGIGRAIAIAMAAAGGKVAITARSEGELSQVSNDIEKAGGQVFAIVADLAEPDAVETILAKVANHWGNVEILVNNAGLGSSSSPRPIVEFDDAFWEQTMHLNVTVPYKLTKAVLPAMIDAKWGRIINISSINAKVAAMHGCAYVASKHAVAGLTKATAMEIAAVGVTCNAICPGVTATAMNDKRVEYDAARLNLTAAEIEAGASPLGRRLQPDEIAPLAVFLASDGARAINGQLLNVCGGRVMV